MPERWKVDGPPEGEAPPFRERLAWMAGLMLAGLVATATLAYGLRALLFL